LLITIDLSLPREESYLAFGCLLMLSKSIVANVWNNSSKDEYNLEIDLRSSYLSQP
jgi:hypothetical protein